VHILNRLESAKFREWSWVVIVAGVGFFTDSYAIFAINMVMPMLGIIYYGDNGGVMPHNYETAMSIVTLGGSIVGQIGFGFGADIWVSHNYDCNLRSCRSPKLSLDSHKHLLNMLSNNAIGKTENVWTGAYVYFELNILGFGQ